MIGISTGCFYKIMEDANNSIEIIKEITDGIELMFQNNEGIKNFDIDPKRLKDFEYISIHSSNESYAYKSDLKTRGLLYTLSNISKRYGVKNIVFHSSDIKDHDAIDGYDFVPCIENDSHKEDTIPIVKEMLSKNKNLRMVFDIAHAMCTIKPEYVLNDIKKLEDKINEFHFSITNNKISHNFLHQAYLDKSAKDVIRYARDLDKPIILEITIQKEEDINLLLKEIEFIKSL